MLNPAKTYRFFLQNDEHDVRVHILASVSAAEKLSANLKAQQLEEGGHSKKFSNKRKARSGQYVSNECERIQEEVRSLQQLLQQMQDLRRRFSAVGGSLETFLSGKVDYVVDILDSLPDRHYSEGQSSALMLINEEESTGHRQRTGNSSCGNTVHESEASSTLPLAVSSASHISVARVRRVTSSRSRKIHDKAKRKRKFSAAERALAAAESGTIRSIGNSTYGFKAGLRRPIRNEVSRMNSSSRKANSSSISASGNASVRPPVVSFASVLSWLSDREAIIKKKAVGQPVESRTKQVPSVPQFVTDVRKRSRFMRGDVVASHAVSQGQPTSARQHVDQSGHHDQIGRHPNALPAMVSDAMSSDATTHNPKDLVDPKLPPRLLIGDSAGVCVRELGATFSGQSQGGREAIASQHGAVMSGIKSRAHTCTVPMLEPSLKAAVAKLVSTRKHQQPSADREAHVNHRRSRRRRNLSSKFSRKLCDKETKNSTKKGIKNIAYSSMDLQKSRNASIQDIMPSRPVFLPLLATSDPGYRIALQPMAKFHLRVTTHVAGYCFCCHRHCANLRDHLEGDPSHRIFNATASNFAELDEFLDKELYANRQEHSIDRNIPSAEHGRGNTQSGANGRRNRVHSQGRGEDLGPISPKIISQAISPDHGVGASNLSEKNSHGHAKMGPIRTPGTVSSKRNDSLINKGRRKKVVRSSHVMDRANASIKQIDPSYKSQPQFLVDAGPGDQGDKRKRELQDGHTQDLAKRRKHSRSKSLNQDKEVVKKRRRTSRQTIPVQQFDPSLPNKFLFFGGEYADKCRLFDVEYDSKLPQDSLFLETGPTSFGLDRYRLAEERENEVQHSDDNHHKYNYPNSILPVPGQRVLWKWNLQGERNAKKQSNGERYGWFSGLVISVGDCVVNIKYDIDGKKVNHKIGHALYGETWKEEVKLGEEEHGHVAEYVKPTRPRRRRVTPEKFEPGGNPRQTFYAVKDNGGLDDESAFQKALQASMQSALVK